jgi:hypothetical protein
MFRRHFSVELSLELFSRLGRGLAMLMPLLLVAPGSALKTLYRRRRGYAHIVAILLAIIVILVILLILTL